MKTFLRALAFVAFLCSALTAQTFTRARNTDDTATGRTVVSISPSMDGFAASLTVGDETFVTLSTRAARALATSSRGGGSSSSSIVSAPAGLGDVMSISWFHESGFHPCRKITVAYERRPGQSIANAAREFREMVGAAMELYPPNCDGSELGIVAGDPGGGIVMQGGSLADAARGPLAWRNVFVDPVGGSLAIMQSPPSNDDTMSISWKHDPDKTPEGDGPLQPTTVTCSTEKRAGESSTETARRLGQMSRALMEVFPPNVPEKTVSIGRPDDGIRLAAVRPRLLSVA